MFYMSCASPARYARRVKMRGEAWGEGLGSVRVCVVGNTNTWQQTWANEVAVAGSGGEWQRTHPRGSE